MRKEMHNYQEKMNLGAIHCPGVFTFLNDYEGNSYFFHKLGVDITRWQCYLNYRND